MHVHLNMYIAVHKYVSLRVHLLREGLEMFLLSDILELKRVLKQDAKKIIPLSVKHIKCDV